MMSTGIKRGRFSPIRLLTPKDYNAFVARREAGPAFSWPLRLLTSRVGWRFLGRVVLSAVGWVLQGPVKWVGMRIQAARFPFSPFLWLQHVIRFFYKLTRRGKPLSEKQQVRWGEAAKKLHPKARSFVLKLKGFQAKLPYNWSGQYAPFGDIALKADNDEPDVNLIRHEWAHYWWFHHMTSEQRAEFMRAVEALARKPDVPDDMQYAQELARAYVEGRDARCKVGDRTWIIPLQSNDGYRIV
jgi:hypothetical protein